MKDLNIGGKYSFADFGYFPLGVYIVLLFNSLLNLSVTLFVCIFL